MRTDLPTPEQMLEELADRVATQIDRLAPVAFDVALDELIRQHSFLLAVNAARTPDGMPFNFAEVPGLAWSAPHKEWMHQYSRLFERAAGRIPDDRSFFAKLARTPIRLLPSNEEPALSRAVLEGIIDLGPLLVHRLEGWVSRRTVVENKAGESAVPRTALTGADSRAYAEVVVDLVGAWEHLLQFDIGLRAERRKAGQTDAEQWDLFREEWPLVWRHLCDTGHMLAAAVWNEDEIGARRYRDMLVRWLKTLGRDDYDLYLLNRRLVFPSIFDKPWGEAVASLKPLLPRHGESLSPSYVAGSVLRCAHDDVALLTGALLLDWTMNEKQPSDIGARTGGALLRRELVDADEHDDREPGIRSFRSTFMDVLRVDLAGERFEKTSYGAQLDSLVFQMDNMSERRVVSGRIYTPSTHHERDDLSFALLVILMAALPEEGDDGFVARVGEIAANEAALPSGDRSLRGLIWVLERFAKSLETPWPQLQRGLAGLKPDADFDALSTRLAAIVGEARAAIETHRTDRIKASHVDPAKLERTRSEIEAAVLDAKDSIPFFEGYRIERHGRRVEAEVFSVVRSNVSKASLLEPAMESESSNFTEVLANGVASSAGNRAWGLFTRRDRETVVIPHRVEEPAFWQEVAKLTPQIAARPALVVSRAAEGRTIRRLLYPTDGTASVLRVEQRSGERRGAYIATVEGVDVYGADFPSGEAWLFSGAALHAIRYSQMNSLGQYVTLAYESDGELAGALRAQFAQTAEWSDDPIFEIRSSDPPEDAEAE